MSGRFFWSKAVRKRLDGVVTMGSGRVFHTVLRSNVGARMSKSGIVVLGIFVADMAFRADRPPRIGETILGNSFMLGPGGKGSNQSVGVARAGGDVTFLSRLGDDTFGKMAREIWSDAGVRAEVISDAESETGAAYIFVDEASGDNAIIVCPGAANAISSHDIEHWGTHIDHAAIFMTQLEQPIETAVYAMHRAFSSGAQTIFNPAPAAEVPAEIWAQCSFVTPNETEAAELTGLPVSSVDQARAAADKLLGMGAGTALITLGEAGALLHGAGVSKVIPAICHAPVVDTTGAGDAFNAGFAVALAEGQAPETAALFGSATAGLAVTRKGTAQAMPERGEIDAALAKARREGQI